MDGQKGQRPGFDYSASFIGQGQYNNCPFEINGVPTPTEGWVDDRSTDFAIEFMKKHKDGPFSLVVGFKTTHGPWQPPDRAADRFAGETIRPAASADVKAIYRDGMEAVAKKKAATKKKAAAAKKKAAGGGGPGGGLNYFRCVSAADDNVGRMLAALDELGIADNTVVIFTSDNGYYLGEHGLGDKRSAYDESLRIPMLLRYPKLSQVRGKLVDAMVLNIDIAPTLLDLAGVPVPKSMQGRSWRPLLEGATPADWRSSYFYEYFFERGYATPTVLAVRTDSAKIIKYLGHDEWTEVFDLKADPYEKTNLANDPSHKNLRGRMEAEFARQKEAVIFRVPEYADVPPG
jgi:arylsulfatase A-like enzyme